MQKNPLWDVVCFFPLCHLCFVTKYTLVYICAWKLSLRWLGYLRVPSNLVAMVSRKVFWGASRPFITGIVVQIWEASTVVPKNHSILFKMGGGPQGWSIQASQKKADLKSAPLFSLCRTRMFLVYNPLFLSLSQSLAPCPWHWQKKNTPHSVWVPINK